MTGGILVHLNIVISEFRINNDNENLRNSIKWLVPESRRISGFHIDTSNLHLVIIKWFCMKSVKKETTTNKFVNILIRKLSMLTHLYLHRSFVCLQLSNTFSLSPFELLVHLHPQMGSFTVLIYHYPHILRNKNISLHATFYTTSITTKSSWTHFIPNYFNSFYSSSAFYLFFHHTVIKFHSNFM